MISVVIPVYNEEARILSTLEKLYNQTEKPEEIIVADGRSTDRTVALIREHYPNVIIVNNAARTAATGRNAGVKVAKGDVIAFTDGDCLVADDWIFQIKNAFEKDEIDGLGGKVLIAEPVNRYEAYWGNLAWNLLMNFGDEPYIVETRSLNDAFVTANCAYRRDLLVNLNGFSYYFGNNAEDVDFSWRALDAGARLKYVPSVKVYAHNVTTIKGIMEKSFRNGVSSSKLQKKYGGRINYDPAIYRMLLNSLIGCIKKEKDAELNSLELICHLAGKYYGSVKEHVINV